MVYRLSFTQCVYVLFFFFGFSVSSHFWSLKLNRSVDSQPNHTFATLKNPDRIETMTAGSSPQTKSLNIYIPLSAHHFAKGVHFQ